MIFSPLNLEKELFRERSRQLKLMDDVYVILKAAAEDDKKLLQRLKATEAEEEINIFLNTEDQSRIFTLDHIKKIAVRYRLRFLDSAFFKNEFPYEAIAEIKNF